MKENIKISSCTDLGNDRLHIVGTTEKNEIEYFYTDKSMFSDYCLLRKEDNLIIEYNKKDKGVQTIINVEKWEISNMKERLIKIIDGKVAEIRKLFEEKIKQLDEEERSDVEKKNNSLQFQQIMHEKAGVLKLLDCSKIEGYVLADYLKEFRNYPVAVELFRSCCVDKTNYTTVIGCLPEDTEPSGENNATLKKT